MKERPADAETSRQDLLSKVSRFEALFELTDVINAASDIESAGEVLARRLKYIVDVYSWRYLCFDGDPDDVEGRQATAIVVDGFRGTTKVTRTTPDGLSAAELELWRSQRTRILTGEPMLDVLSGLPDYLRKGDLEQISVNTLVDGGRTRALHLFLRRRRPFSELDYKYLAMVCGFFHRKIHMLWEQRKLRELELAYLNQEVTLRQSERLATLGRMSAGMAHELNNPASAARQGAEHLKSSIDRLERAGFALGAAGLPETQRELIEELEREAGVRAGKPGDLDPIARADLEEEVEEWLSRLGVENSWEHAPGLVALGFGVPELEGLVNGLDPGVAPVVLDYLSSHFTTRRLLEEIGHGARRISEIVKALKGYSYMDQGPVQSVDVREGLNDTIVMLGSRLRDGIKVEFDYAEDLPRIQGYGSELNQVWTNIVDNAISAMEGRGLLRLSAHRDGDCVVVEVADTGPGIATEHQGRIFDPFFTTKPPGEGTGLGLNISHGIVVEKHRGRISVDSKPGDTRFRVRLPITVASPRAAGGDEAPSGRT